MQLNALQQQLERIYELTIGQDVSDYVTSDTSVVKQLVAHSDLPLTPEQLFVLEDGEYMDVSLFIEENVLERLASDNPIERLHDGNLEDYLTVLEGVSHFLYLLWHAYHDREVSPLELELQAEVDKYVSSAFLFTEQGQSIPGGLSEVLFDNTTIDSRMDEAIVKRYQEATYYARNFCETLQTRFLGPNRQIGLVNEIRRFYRYTRWQKIDHIAANSGARFKHFVYRH